MLAPSATATDNAVQLSPHHQIGHTLCIIGCDTSLLEHGHQLAACRPVMLTMAEIVAIPGVGRKTANVILGNAFGATEGFIVDTHVERLAQRFGWTHHKDAIKIEQALMRMIPQQEWLNVAHRMIAHGRTICIARKPLCSHCPLAKLCPSAQSL